MFVPDEPFSNKASSSQVGLYPKTTLIIQVRVHLSSNIHPKPHKFCKSTLNGLSSGKSGKVHLVSGL